MSGILAVAGENLLSPIILSFVLGLIAALARSDLSFPEAIAKGLSIYLLFAIGFKGGAGVAVHGVDARLVAALLTGIALSLALPPVAFALLRALARVPVVDAAAVAGHYGSISIVTFLAAGALLTERGVAAEGYMVAVAAAMEAPAIASALWLAARGGGAMDRPGAAMWREVLLNGSIVLLVGAFAIGWVTGQDGLTQIEGFIVSPFKGVLCLFLLDMGLVAGRGLRNSRSVLTPGIAAFGVIAGLALGLSLGGTVLMMVLCASASYIAVPAAMRVALPQANPALSLTLALGVTFPFNLILGIPLYLMVAELVLRP
jgi:uncharacterized protein